MDRWDAVGAAGALLVALGLGALGGWPWAALWGGGLLLGLYALREARHAAQDRRKG